MRLCASSFDNAGFAHGVLALHLTNIDDCAAVTCEQHVTLTIAFSNACGGYGLWGLLDVCHQHLPVLPLAISGPELQLLDSVFLDPRATCGIDATVRPLGRNGTRRNARCVANRHGVDGATWVHSDSTL